MAVAHKGAISFGLVYIPIQMFRTTQENDISFNQLCKQTKERVKYKKYCANCDKELKSEDIIKGYQYEKDQYVTMSNEEIEALKGEKDRTIAIQHFSTLSDINTLYYEKNYYAIPDKNAEKAYELLRKAMLAENVVAIAKSVIGTKETLLALCPLDDKILVKTLFYDDEIADMPKAIAHPKVAKAELDIAKQLIKSMNQAFDSSQYHDEFQERLKEALEHKINGEQTTTKKKRTHDVASPIDLMDALKDSIAAMKPMKTKRKSVRH